MLPTLNDHVLEFLQNNDSEHLFKKWKSKTNQDSLKLLIKTECPTKKTKKVKDPDAPSKNKTAYMIFCQEKRSEVTAKGVSGQSIFTQLGEMWQKCKEKKDRCFKEYQNKALLDAERYKEEMENYNNE